MSTDLWNVKRGTLSILLNENVKISDVKAFMKSIKDIPAVDERYIEIKDLTADKFFVFDVNYDELKINITLWHNPEDLWRNHMIPNCNEFFIYVNAEQILQAYKEIFKELNTEWMFSFDSNSDIESAEIYMKDWYLEMISVYSDETILRKIKETVNSDVTMEYKVNIISDLANGVKRWDLLDRNKI